MSSRVFLFDANGRRTSEGSRMSFSKEQESEATPHEPRILPLVMRMRASIDQVFSRYVGPISAELSAEEFDRWRLEGQVGPRALHRYISRLARYIPEDELRRDFMGYAARCIQLLAVAKA